MRVLLVDDSATFLMSASRFLESMPGLELLGHAVNGEQALQMVPLMLPDLVLMDMDMPVMGGIEAGRKIMMSYPHINIIFLSVNQGKEYQDLALTSGGRAFIPKSSFVSSLSNLLSDWRLNPRGEGGAHHA